MTDIGSIQHLDTVQKSPVEGSPRMVVESRLQPAKPFPLKADVQVSAPESIAPPEFSRMLNSLPIEETVPEAAQVTSVSQLADVRPTDWAFQALQALVERYGCIAGDPGREALPSEGRTFRGDRSLTRYEFAAGLNACLNRVHELIASRVAEVSFQKSDLETLKKLQDEFAAELKTLRDRVTDLETRTTTIEKRQFSTTTKLFGQVVGSIQGSNEVEVDLFPRDGTPERQGKLNTTFSNTVQLSLATTFTGRDLLLTSLSTGNLSSTAPYLLTNMGRLAYEAEQENHLVISDLSYRFPVGANLGVIVGTAGVNPANTFRGINPLEGYGDGALSLLGQRNPILAIGNGTGGAGIDWQITPRISLQGVYSADLPSFAGDQNSGGLFGGRYTLGAQLTVAPTNQMDAGIHYLFSHSPDSYIGGGSGDTQLISPFAPSESAFNTHAIGASAAWRMNPKMTIGGWGGWTTSRALDLSGSVQTTNWMVFSAFPDLFARGNLGGVLFGQPPKIKSSNLPTGYNYARFSDNGEQGGQPDTAYHLEVFYRARVADFFDLTPGVLVVFHPNHNRNSETVVVGGLRATFRF